MDPIGSCVGQKGMRIANVMSELGEEKIDIIEWADSVEEFVANALGPAQVEKVQIPEEGVAKVHLYDEQLSLAIGKDGQNVRIAEKLTDMKIDITAPGLDESRRTTDSGEEAGGVSELSSRVMNVLEKAEVSVADLGGMSIEEISEIKGVGKVALEEIRAYLDSKKSAEKVSQSEEEQSEDSAEGGESESEEKSPSEGSEDASE